VASTLAARDSPLTVIVTVLSISNSQPALSVLRATETQMPFGIAVKCVDDQSGLHSRDARHLELQLRAAVDSGFGLEFVRIGGAFNARHDAGVVHRFAALPVLNGDIQRGVLSRKPSLRIDQNEGENLRDGCCVRNACGGLGFLRQGKM